MKLNHQYYIGNKAIADIRWLAVIFIGQILVSNMLGKKPKYRNGQTLVNKKTGRQVIIKKALTSRQVTRNCPGSVDEFTGEYSAVEFDD